MHTSAILSLSIYNRIAYTHHHTEQRYLLTEMDEEGNGTQ